MDIDIKAQLGLLNELQSIDIELRDIKEKLSEIPEQIKEAASELSQISSELSQKEAEKAAAEAGKRAFEAELADNIARLTERENKLYAIKTNKEYQAALKEITDAKKANNECEEAIIKLMEKIEGLGQETTQLSTAATDKQLEFKNEEEELNAKKVELEKAFTIKAKEVESVRVNVDKDLLKRYDIIRNRHLDPLAGVIGGICQGCNLNVPLQTYNELLKGLKIHFCPNCNRFMFAEEAAEESEEKE